jgi:hypothetical protein
VDASNAWLPKQRARLGARNLSVCALSSVRTR